MAQSSDIITNLVRSGRTRIVAALAIAAIVAGALGAIVLRAGLDDYALLYSNLDLSEAANIAGRLDQANIHYEMRGDGSAIFVDRARVLDARMMLSRDGLPSFGSVGYEIFDAHNSLGTTSFVQNVNRLRALEGELARTIVSLDNIRAARVHIVLPERRLFERNEVIPTASIVISTIGLRVDNTMGRAIRNLVASSVSGLKPEQITLLDDQGRLISAGMSEEMISFGGMSASEFKASNEARIRQTVMQIVEGVVGSGAAHVQVSTEIDYDRVTQSSEVFDPESRVVRSTQTTQESSDENSTENRDVVTVAENLPNADGAQGPAQQSQQNSNRTQETVNYDISKTTRTEISEPGQITRLSVAVAIDDARSLDEEGNPVFTARSDEDITRITALVRSAIGFDEARGDLIEVVNIRFAQSNLTLAPLEPPGPFSFDKYDIMRGVEIFALLICAIALILFILKPLINSLTKTSYIRDSKDVTTSKNNDETDIVMDSDGNPISSEIAAALKAEGALGYEDNMIDVAQIAGKVKASSLRRIAKIVDDNPDESVAIIRAWLNEVPEKAA